MGDIGSCNKTPTKPCETCGSITGCGCHKPPCDDDEGDNGGDNDGDDLDGEDEPCDVGDNDADADDNDSEDPDCDPTDDGDKSSGGGILGGLLGGLLKPLGLG